MTGVEQMIFGRVRDAKTLKSLCAALNHARSEGGSDVCCEAIDFCIPESLRVSYGDGDVFAANKRYEIVAKQKTGLLRPFYIRKRA